MNGSETRPLDLFVVGGGINGAGIACDAAGRALKVGLCEMNDFASATSSKATKLIHGGLRYLEFYEFRLVRTSRISGPAGCCGSACSSTTISTGT